MFGRADQSEAGGPASGAAAVMEPVEQRVMLAIDLAISEFLAANTRFLADRDGEYSDWIEIYNRGDTTVSMGGWHLTDDPDQLDQWEFPVGNTLAPGEYLMVFASDKLSVPGELHANFRLEKSGEYLALVRPDGLTIEHEYTFFPAQTEDVSYGLARPDAPKDEHAFFSIPTPGEPNPVTTPTTTLTPVFSQVSQTFAGTLTVELTTSSPTAQIRYTTDRSTPIATSPLYTGPLELSSNTLLRARVFEAGKHPGPVKSETYMAMAANVQNFESNMPVIVLDLFGQSLNDRNLTPVAAYVIDTNPLDGRARMADLPQYSGRSGLRLRGQSSQGFPKRPYAFETWDELGYDKSVPLLGMPSESDWVLYNPYSEKSLMQNYLAYSWAREMGRYAPRVRFVEMFVNTSGSTLDYGDYVGVYILVEKIKVDANRIDIARLRPGDNSGEDITGGYIFKIDKTDPGESRFFTSRGYGFLHVEPESYELTQQQKSYLTGYLNQFEAALYGPTFTDPVNGYAKYIDVDSWIDHHIMVEMSKNIDGFRISTYFHKDRGGKIKMEPIWDYNLSMGNANYNDGNDPRDWYYQAAGLGGNDYAYWPRLFEDPNFRQRYADRWQELRSTVFRTDEMMADIDAAVQILTDGTNNFPVGRNPQQAPNNPLVRNFRRWNVLGEYLWPNAVAHDAWIDELNYLKNFLTTRWAWIDSQYLAAPTTTGSGGEISAPTLFGLSGPGGGAQIYYTTDGSDPRVSGGAISPAATRYTSALTIDSTARVLARSYRSGQWSGLIDVSFFRDEGLRVSEVMYHPHDPPAGSTHPDDAYEFIELHNAGTSSIDLSGYSFDKGITFTFPAGSVLGAGEYRVVVSDAEAFAERYPGVQIDGTYAGRLDNTGERVRLVNAAGAPVIDFRYGDGRGWPGRADGGASSLEPVALDGDALDDPKRWRSSTDFGGSPRAAAGGSPPGVIINEVLAHTTAPLVDSIELHNPTGDDIDVSGWYLSDSQGNYAKFRIPDGTIIAAGGYLVFDEGDFNPTPWNPAPHHFALNGTDGDDVWLVRADPDGRLRAFVDSIHFAGGAAADGASLGRMPNGSGRLRPLLAPSLGGPNRPQAVGSVLISEVVYNHQGGKDVAEFVELHNVTAAPIDISGWRFNEGIEFTFPAGTTIPAFGTLLVVPFDPLDPREAPRLNLFRATYGLNPSVPLVGGFAGRLENAGETVRLARPETLGPGQPIAYVAVDEIDYHPTAPWPTSPDGGGMSLVRLGLLGSGHDVASWSAMTPSPGTHAFPAVAIQGSDADDLYEVRLGADGTYAEVYYAAPGSTPAFAYAFQVSGTDWLSIAGGAGNDSFTIDASAATLPSPLTLALADDGGAGDDLSLIGPVALSVSEARQFGDLSLADGATMTLLNSAAITANDLALSDGARLDIGIGRILARQGSLSAISQLIAAARNGASEQWGGAGITSSAAAGDPLTTVAVIEDDAGVHVAYTYVGDANLDGLVNFDDYFRIDSAYLAQPENPSHDQGDFNYDGQINFDDYFLIDSAFLEQGEPLAASALSAGAAPALFSTTEVSEMDEPEARRPSIRSSPDDGVLARSVRRPAQRAARAHRR